MLATISVHEEISQRVIGAIENGQCPPWRRPISAFENDGFPTHPSTLKPLKGVNVLILNISATEKGYRSKFWGTEQEWAYLHCTPTGQATILADGMPVFNADQLFVSRGSVVFFARVNRTLVTFDVNPIL